MCFFTSVMHITDVKKANISLDVQTLLQAKKNNIFQFYEVKKCIENFVGMNFEHFHIY